MLELRDLRLVNAVADHGTLTRAAGVLYLTQSALSHQLADLEGRLGTTLFHRGGRRMVLTPAGERLLETAREVLGTVARAVDEVRDVAQETEAVLRFGTECYTCYHWLPGVLREYRRHFPRVETRVVASVTRRPIAALLRGDLDVALVSEPVPHRRRVDITSLFHDELLAIVAPDHPWAGRPFVTAEDFAAEHLLVYNEPRTELHIFRDVLMPAGVNPRQVSRMELTEAIVELARAGMGVGVLARWAVAPHLRTGALCGVRVTEGGMEREWAAATPLMKAVPVHLRAFVDLLSGMAEPLPATGPGWCAA